MRLLRQLQQDFGLLFLTQDEPFELRKIEHCRLRSAPVATDSEEEVRHGRNGFTCPDRFLYFTDLDTNQPKQCRKRLIRQVRFRSVWYKVEWFN